MLSHVRRDTGAREGIVRGVLIINRLVYITISNRLQKKIEVGPDRLNSIFLFESYTIISRDQQILRTLASEIHKIFLTCSKRSFDFMERSVQHNDSALAFSN